MRPKTRLKLGLRFCQLLLVLSSLALVFSLRLPANLAQILAAYFNLQFGPTTPFSSLFSNWNAPFPAFGLVAWLIWLAAALVLLKYNSKIATKPALKQAVAPPFTSSSKNLLNWLSLALAFILILLIAFWSRAAQLLPDAFGQMPASNYDEMVYFSGASLWAQGNWPYHDFLLAHPPGALLLVGTWLKIWGLAGGGHEALLAARQLCVGLGVLTTAGVFWTAGRLWAKPGHILAGWAGAGAALVYAADGRASQVAVLETVANYWAVLAFGVFVETKHLPTQSRWHKILLLLTGFLAASAFLAKLPGLALFVALLVYLIWKNFRQWHKIAWIVTGFGAGLLIVGGFFVLKGGIGTFLRQVIFFQLLRPQEVRSGIDEIARVSDYPEIRLTVLLAALALLLISYRVIRQRIWNDLWLIPAIWSAPLLAVFIFGKSFHPWYYVQLALPLALLTGGLFCLPNFEVATIKMRPFQNQALLKSGAGLLILFLLAFPAFVTEWDTSHTSSPEKTYQPMADYIRSQAVPNDGQLLSFDPGFALLSGLKSARLPDGKLLVDSAGYMVYLNLDIDRRSLFSLLSDGLASNRERGQVEATFGKARGQALVSEAIAAQRWAVLDVKLGLAQLTPQTVEFLQGATASPPVNINSNQVWQGRASSSLREWRFDNGLQLFPLGLTLSVGKQANVVTADDGDILHLSPAQTTGGVLDLRMVWRVVKQPLQQSKLFVHLINGTGQTVAQSDLALLEGQADITGWQPGDAYQDIHSLPLPQNLAAGRYSVQIGLYNPVDGARVRVEGQDSLMLGYVEVGTGR